MGLFKPRWMSNNEDRAWSAAYDVTDQAELRRIALESQHESVRLLAVKRLTDVAVLETVLKDEGSEKVCAATRAQIDSIHRAELSEKVLAELPKMESQEEIASYVTCPDVSEDVHQAASVLLRDRALVMGVLMKESPNHCVLENLMEKVTFEDDLLDLARSASTDEVREAAMRRVSRKALVELATGEKESKGTRLLARAAVEARNGFVCSFCGKVSWCENGHPGPCFCEHCGSENHRFERREASEFMYDAYNWGLNPGEPYWECTRCGRVEA